MSSYSFEDRGTDRQTKSISECTLKKTFQTRPCAIQHKCLPHLACINPTPLLFLKIETNSKNDSEILIKLHTS